MRPVLLSLATAALLATVGSAWADPDRDESGRGDGGRRGQPREAGRRAREAGKELGEVRLAQAYGDTYRNSGYRGYTPVVPYPNVAPQPGGYPGYPNRDVNSYGNYGNYGNGQGTSLTDQLLGRHGNLVGYGQGGYGQPGYAGNPSSGPGVSYGPGAAPYPYGGPLPSQTGGYNGDPNRYPNPYQTGQYPPASDPGYPPPRGNFGDPRQSAAPYPGSYAQPPGNPNVLQAPPGPPSGGQITALADQLVGQASVYLREFAPKVGIVPESQAFLADGTALRDAAARLRGAAAAGVPPAALEAELRDVEACWQRLEARMARVSKGRIGPNIARNLQMGGTIEQIRQLMP